MILENDQVEEDDSFLIRIIQEVVWALSYALTTVKEVLDADHDTENQSTMHYEWSSDVTKHLAQQLTNENNGDLMFVVPGRSNDKSTAFYAWKHILEIKGASFLESISTHFLL